MFLYRWSLPLILLWILSGHLVQHSSDAIVVALYAAIDRVGFAIIGAFALIGFFHNIDSMFFADLFIYLLTGRDSTNF